MDSKRIQLMRFIDCYIGVPVCFFLRCFELIARRLSSRPVVSPKKILFIKPSEMGALFHVVPLIKKVQRRYPGAEVYVLTFKKNAIVFDLVNVVPKENVFTIRSYSPISFVIDVIHVLWQVRTRAIDTVYDLEFFARFTAIVTYLTGARNRIGFSRYGFEGLYRGDLFTHEVPYNPYFHIREMYAFFATVDVCDPQPVLPMNAPVDDDGDEVFPLLLSEATRERVIRMINDLPGGASAKTVLVYPGNGQLSLREWHHAHLKQLIDRLIKNECMRVVIIGCKNTMEKAASLADEIRDARCINWAGKLMLEEVCALFECSDLFVGSDCGLAHLASLTPIRQVILFGPETPAVFGPRGEHAITLYKKLPCSPCFSILNHRRSLCRDNQCLAAITPDEVFSVAMAQLQKDG